MRKTTRFLDSIYSETGKIIIKKNEIRQRFVQNIQHLNDSNRDKNFLKESNKEGSEILKKEIKHTLNSIKNINAAGPVVE